MTPPARRDRLRHDLQGARARGGAVPALPADRGARAAADHRHGGAAALEARRAGRGAAGGVPARSPSAPGSSVSCMRWAVEETACAVAGLPEREDPAPRRPEDPLRLPRDRGAGQRRRAGPAAVRPGAGAAGPADQRARRHVRGRAHRPRRREPAAHGRARGARRLRERLLGAGAPDPAADRHPPARPLADQPDRPRPAEPGALRVDRRHRPCARARRRGRRRRDPGAAGRAVRLRVSGSPRAS